MVRSQLRKPSIHPHWITRTALLDRLRLEPQPRALLLSAPAGYGKSSLLSSWADSEDPNRSFAWYSVDLRDNELRRFVRQVTAALASTGVENADGQPLGSESATLAHSSVTLDPARYALQLVDEIDAAGQSVSLILDDYHQIDDLQVHGFVSSLVSTASEYLQVVISTRVDPPIHLGKLRASQQLVEFRSQDLRFTETESEAYLNGSLKLGIGADHLMVLRNRLEGWPVGVQLAALSLHGSSDPQTTIATFGGDHRFVLDFLSEEVLHSLDPEDVSFLTQVSVLDRFSAELSDAVVQVDDSRDRIERLVRANLFLTALDDTGTWFRFHHLFRDLLLTRLKRTEPLLIPELRLRAGEWFAERDMVEEAIAYLQSSGDEDRVCRLLDGIVDGLWSSGEHAQLARLLDAVSEAALSPYPRLRFASAYAEIERGDFAAAEHLIEGSDADDAPDWVRGRASALRGFIAGHRGDIPAFTRHAEAALALLPHSDTAWRAGAAIALGDIYALTGQITLAYETRLKALPQFASSADHYMWLAADSKQSINLREQGRLAEAVENCERCVGYAADHGLALTAVAGSLRATWAEALAELGDLDAATRQANQALEICDSGGDVALLVWTLSCLVRVSMSAGAVAEALSAVDRMKSLCRQHELPVALQMIAANSEARVVRRVGDALQIRSWLEEHPVGAEDPIPYLKHTELIEHARLLAADGRPRESRILLERFLQFPEAGGHASRQLNAMLGVSIAAHQEGDSDAATEWMRRAVDLSARCGFAQTFVDEGTQCAEILRHTGVDGVLPARSRDLLMAFPVAEPGVPPDPDAGAQRGQFEQLSSRELDVLRLLATGSDNQEIGNALFISPHTVKAHTRSIYAKLDVHNRFEATIRARLIGILQD